MSAVCQNRRGLMICKAVTPTSCPIEIVIFERADHWLLLCSFKSPGLSLGSVFVSVLCPKPNAFSFARNSLVSILSVICAVMSLHDCSKFRPAPSNIRDAKDSSVERVLRLTLLFQKLRRIKIIRLGGKDPHRKPPRLKIL